MPDNADQSASEKLQDASILRGISMQRVTKTMRSDVFDMLVELRDQLVAKLNSTATITDWQRQRIESLLARFCGSDDRDVVHEDQQQV